MPKSKLPSDKRLNWRDPNMPVLMRASFDGGKTFQLTEIEPEAVQKYYENKMASVFSRNPNWDDDPTYFMNKTKNKS